MSSIGWASNTGPYLPAIKTLKNVNDDGKDDIKAGIKSMRDYLLNPDKKFSLSGRGEIEKDEESLRKAELHLKDSNGVPCDEKVP